MASDKEEFSNEIILDNDPDIFIQETWFTNFKLNGVLRSINDMNMADGVSTVMDDELLKGISYRGLDIL